MGSINFQEIIGEAKTASFDPMPIGAYTFAVEEAGYKLSGNGKHMVVVKFRCAAGPHAKRAITNNFVLSPDSPVALAIWLRQMVALGVPEASIAALGVAEDLQPLIALIPIGRLVTLDLGQEEWPKGNTPPTMRNNVRNISPAANNGVPGVIAAPGVPTGIPQVPQVPVASPVMQAPPVAMPPVTAPPVTSPAPPVPVAQPAPAPAPTPVVVPPAAPPIAAPAPAPVVDDTPVPGTEAFWATLPPEAKAAMRAQYAAATAQSATVPPPPQLPV